MAKRVPLKVTVRRVAISKDETRNIRFAVLPKTRRVRVTSLHKPPLFMSKFDNGKFGIAIKGELPVQAPTPDQALAKGIKRFWA